MKPSNISNFLFMNSFFKVKLQINPSESALFNIVLREQFLLLTLKLYFCNLGKLEI